MMNGMKLFDLTGKKALVTAAAEDSEREWRKA